MCERNHPQCRPPLYASDSTFRPKRLLHIGHSEVKVVHDHNADRWACLSYCWGDKPNVFKLTSHNLEQYKVGIARSTLPRLYQDAAQVCAWMGVEFIWIDAMCIIQDDHQDWIEQAALMASIFANGVFTIAAQDAAGPFESLLTDTYDNWTGDWSPVFGYAEAHLYVQRVREKRIKEKGEYLLDTRAWTYQELELSTRIISFAGDTVAWQCREEGKNTLSAELRSAASLTPYGIRTAKTLSEHIDGTHWYKLVSPFSKRALTFQSDRLPALAAVAEETHRRCPELGDYLVGMWRNTLIRDMCWYRDLYVFHAYPHMRTANRASTTALSWSWASITSPVDWDKPHQRSGVGEIARVVVVHMNSAGSPYLGITTKAALTIQAPYILLDVALWELDWRLGTKATFKVRDPPHVENKVFSGPCRHFISKPTIILDAAEDEWCHIENLKGDYSQFVFVFVFIGYASDGSWYLHGLLLRRNPERSSYRRVGYCKFKTCLGAIAREWNLNEGKCVIYDTKDIKIKKRRWYDARFKSVHEIAMVFARSLPLSQFTIE